MKKQKMFIIIAIVALSLFLIVVLLNEANLLTIVQYPETYNKSFSIDTIGISFNSCHDVAIYQTGNCNYLYGCYLILPQNCSTISCSKGYSCTEILSLTNPETITVTYSTKPEDIGKTYAVSAFILDTQLNYNFSTKAWTETSAPIESTKQYDSIENTGAPLPPQSNPLAAVGQWIGSILSGISGFFCSTLGLFC